MKIHHEELSDIVRYIEKNKNTKLEEKENEFKRIFNFINKHKAIHRETKILEIGIGTGWFPIVCKKRGLSCKGLEISPHLIDNAKNFGQKYGIVPDLQLGNIEETDIGVSKYDIIIANSVFEHVEYWQNSIEKVFAALKKGGLFYFTSTNKFSPISGEYNFPLYGWLPNSWRYNLRKLKQGKDIMKLGIDFNQFTYFQLRDYFEKLGFSIVLDKLEILDPENLYNQRFGKKTLLKVLKRVKFLKHCALVFQQNTVFICIK